MEATPPPKPITSQKQMYLHRSVFPSQLLPHKSIARPAEEQITNRSQYSTSNTKPTTPTTMSPPSATMTSPSPQTNGSPDTTVKAPLEPGLTSAQAKVQMPNFPGPPTFTSKYEERDYLKGRLACAFRIFGKYGFDEGVAGHITLRDPVEPHTFWVNPFGVAFSLIKTSDLIRVDYEAQILEGGEVRLLNAAAFMIHAAIHKARPDVLCAAHSHSIYGRSFCALGRPLDIITQDSCAFHNDHALYTSFNGIVLAEKEGLDIASALGTHKAALLQNHGLLTVGRTVESAVFWFVSLEKCCHAQLMADAAAGGRGQETKKIGDAEAAFTWKTVGTERAGWFSAKPLFDVVERECGGDFFGSN